MKIVSPWSFSAMVIRNVFILLGLTWASVSCTFIEYASYYRPTVSATSLTSKALGDGVVFKTHELCLRVAEGSGTYHDILGGPVLPLFPAFLNPFQWLRKIDWYEERQWFSLELEPRSSALQLDLHKIYLELHTGEKITPDLYQLWYIYSPREPLRPITQNTEAILIKYGLNPPTKDYSKEIKTTPKFSDGFIPPAFTPPPVYEQVSPPFVTHVWLGFKKSGEDFDARHLIINGIHKQTERLSIPTIDLTKQSEFRMRSSPSDKPTNLRDSPGMFIHGLCVHVPDKVVPLEHEEVPEP